MFGLCDPSYFFLNRFVVVNKLCRGTIGVQCFTINTSFPKTGLKWAPLHRWNVRNTRKAFECDWEATKEVGYKKRICGSSAERRKEGQEEKKRRKTKRPSESFVFRELAGNVCMCGVHALACLWKWLKCGLDLMNVRHISFGALAHEHSQRKRMSVRAANPIES